MGSIVVPFRGLYLGLGSSKVLPKRNYYGAYGYRANCTETMLASSSHREAFGLTALKPRQTHETARNAFGAPAALTNKHASPI